MNDNSEKTTKKMKKQKENEIKSLKLIANLINYFVEH